MSELWENPLYSVEERLEMAIGAIKFRDAQLRQVRSRCGEIANGLKGALADGDIEGGYTLDVARDLEGLSLGLRPLVQVGIVLSEAQMFDMHWDRKGGDTLWVHPHKKPGPLYQEASA